MFGLEQKFHRLDKASETEYDDLILIKSQSSQSSITQEN